MSAGPDRRFGTEDDLAVIIDLTEGHLFAPGGRGTIALKIEHDRGPFDGLAEATGSVIDVSGADVPRAKITLEALGTGVVRHAISDALGTWTLTGLPPGTYRVTIASPGFMISTQTFSVVARDQAILRATLNVGTVNETVTVAAAAPVVLATEAAVFDAVREPRAAGMALAAPMAKPTSALATLKSAPASTQTEAHTRSYLKERKGEKQEEYILFIRLSISSRFRVISDAAS